jgi:TolA-binding protein
MMSRRIRNLLLALSGLFLAANVLCFAQSAQSERSEDLAKTKETYLKDNKYSEFVDYLKGLKTADPAQEAYYVALTRYEQLKYLEATQNWDEYFSKGNDYRDELTKKAQEAIGLTAPKDKINIFSRCILWQFHKDQQDVFEANTLEELVNAVKAYSSEPSADIAVIKYVADKLSSYDERVRSRELYDIYVKKLITPETKEETLAQVADEIYRQGNAELSALVYDAYIERIIKSQPKEKVIPTLFSIARLFAYKDRGTCDPAYAEKVFRKIEEIGGIEAFDEESMYLRAWNLEKSHAYSDAKAKYLALLDRFPRTGHNDEAVYKCGIIATYVLRDIGAGTGYFEQLASKQTVSPQVVSSIYQLGLLSQWKKDLEKAKGYYNKVLESAGDKFADTVSLARERLKELEGTGEIEYNLRTFLDVSLKDEYASFDMSKVDLKSSPYTLLKDQKADIAASTYLPESGCMSIEINYLWSGHLGTANPSTGQAGFGTSYSDPGTKEVNVVVISPSGIVDRRVDMLDDYNQ